MAPHILKHCVNISTEILKLREEEDFEDDNEDGDDDDDDENEGKKPKKDKEFEDTLEAHIQKI